MSDGTTKDTKNTKDTKQVVKNEGELAAKRVIGAATEVHDDFKQFEVVFALL